MVPKKNLRMKYPTKRNKGTIQLPQIWLFISEYEVIRLGQMKIEHGGHDSLRMQIANALDMGELNWLNRLVYKLAIYQSNIKVEENISSEEIDAKRDTIKRNNEFFTHIDF